MDLKVLWAVLKQKAGKFLVIVGRTINISNVYRVVMLFMDRIFIFWLRQGQETEQTDNDENITHLPLQNETSIDWLHSTQYLSSLSAKNMQGLYYCFHCLQKEWETYPSQVPLHQVYLLLFIILPWLFSSSSENWWWNASLEKRFWKAPVLKDAALPPFSSGQLSLSPLTTDHQHQTWAQWQCCKH